ncbi:TIM barrel protein [Microbacterium ulmi]|uniref:Sugar phosphate isomerase/epimerase n=1 Tax=Microbacterium ulmi TaxID=179095 RepID=A0A7Y2M4C9_9MICO|nr:sugar phosphate isomerase/epimerase [Microbacterium ulmi]NNH04878.1 sugar phosphate isomerase/epimerase [Microbacterium ulmi]
MWPWKWDAPYDTAIQRIADTGFRATELMAWNNDILVDYYTPETIDKLRGILAERDLTLSQFMLLVPQLSSGDAEIRKAAIAQYKRGVDVAVDLGAPNINTVTHYPFDITMPRITDRPHVQVFTVDVPSGLDWRQNWNEYIASLREIVDYADSKGKTFSLEPHPFRYGATTEALLRIIDAVDSPALRVNLDPSHLFPAGDIIHVAIHRLEGRVVHCHFSDNDGLTNVHWRPGKGKIDWEKALIALKETGFDGVISLELEDIPGVARGIAKVPGVYRGYVEATEEFVEEHRIGLAYLTELAHKVGMTVE